MVMGEFLLEVQTKIVEKYVPAVHLTCRRFSLLLNGIIGTKLPSLDFFGIPILNFGDRCV